MAVLVKRSSVAGKVPLTTDLNFGEIAVNSNDGRMFMKANNGGGDTIVEITSVTSLLNKSVTTNVTLTATEYSNAMLVFSGALTGNTVITVPNTAHSFIAVNKTTGNYSLTLKASGQTPSVAIVQGAAESLLCDTTGIYATASTTGIEFSKTIPVTSSVTADITYAGAVLIVTLGGAVITLPAANSYPSGAGFGVINLSGANITIAGNGSDTSEIGLPLTVKNNDSYYLASDNSSKWHCVWYSNPLSPTFTSATVTGLLNAGSLSVSGTTTASGGLSVTGTSSLNGPVVLTNAGPSVAFNAGGPTLSSPASNTLAASNGSSEVFRINSAGHLLIGTTADDGASLLQVNGDITSTSGKIIATRFGQTGALRLRSAAGTQGSPTLTPTATQISTIISSGYDGTNYQDGASVDAWSEGAYSNTSAPTNLRFYTAPSGAITKSERMRITAGGQVLIGQTSNDGSSALQVGGVSAFNGAINVGGAVTATGIVTGTNSAGAVIASNGSGAGQTSFTLLRVGAPADQKKWEFMQDGSGVLNIRTVNDAYSASQTALQVTRGSTYTLGAMSLMPTGGHVMIGSTTDDGVNELQVTGTVKSTAGFVFPDGTTQTTANGVTAPTSTLYTPANGVTNWSIGSYNVGFVQVFKNNLRLVPVVDFQATDGTTLTVTTAATGRDRYEVLTSVVYSPSVVFAPTSYTTSITSGQSLITTNYNVGCVWVFKNNMKLLPADFTATNGSTITLTNASDSSTDVYEVVTFQPFAVSGMLPLTGGTMTGNIIRSGAAGTWRGFQFATSGTARWGIGENQVAESGSNVGSNLSFDRYDDTGTWVDTPFSINRATGLVTLSQGLIMPDGYTQVITPSGRNRITNGSCRVTQRGAGSYGNTVSGYSGADMFNSNNTAGGVFSHASGTITYNNVARKAIVQTVTTGGAAFTTTNLWLGIQTRMEGQHVHDFLNGYGSLSFIWNTNVTGTFGVQLFENTGGNSYVTTFAATANVPTRVTIPAIPFPSTLGIPNTNGLGLLLSVGSITGPSFQTSTLNAWQTGNLISNSAVTNWASTVGNFIALTELQLEPGKSCTPFEQLHPSVEFSQCQRYYEVVPLGGHIVYNQGPNTGLFTVYFNTQKRIAPTLGYNLTGVATEVTIPSANITSLAVDRANTQHMQILISGSGGSAAGTCGRIIGTNAGYVSLSAEL